MLETQIATSLAPMSIPASPSGLVPTSTYRLQFSAEFGFCNAIAIVPYLDRLGISHVYASPLLRARAASTHGYDVVDPTMLDPKFGTYAEFVELSQELRRRGMGLVLDIVPNHMAASTENPWWLDVLTRGRESTYGDFFDIDWDANGGRVLLPILQGPDDPRGTLPEVPDNAHYELADWHDQATRLNYRRFFDVADLVCLRAERQEVFDASHALVLQLIADGLVHGLRVDHVDGLADPRRYLERLQCAASDAAGVAQGTFWIVVEKILGAGETLPEGWAVAGATGYEWLDAADAVLTDGYGARRLQRGFAEVTGETTAYDTLTYALKLRTGRNLFAGELGALARMAAPQLPGEPAVAVVGDALLALTAGLDVYRTYIDDDGASIEDRARIGDAARRAIEAATVSADPDAADPALVVQLTELILTDRQLATRWQQFSGPLMAKSVEDTAFYRFVAVPSRDEVGADPGQPSLAVATFHELMAQRLIHTPAALNASTTHDTKRSEDVRARLSVLTCRHEEWLELVEARFATATVGEDLTIAGGGPPDRVDGYLALTTLVGAWPIERERLAEYLTKALREGKRRTSWVEPDVAYETRLIDWIDAQRDVPQVRAFAEALGDPGDQVALTELALKLVAPGIPDIYQGMELSTLSLVDPDNRRPVDYPLRERLLDQLDANIDSGDAQVPDKLRLLAAGLRLRRDQPDLFARGEYLALSIQGPNAGRAIGCARQLDGQWLLLIAPRLDDGVEWGDEIVLPPINPDDGWHCAITGDRVTNLAVGSMFARFPVALITN